MFNYSKTPRLRNNLQETFSLIPLYPLNKKLLRLPEEN